MRKIDKKTKRKTRDGGGGKGREERNSLKGPWVDWEMTRKEVRGSSYSKNTKKTAKKRQESMGRRGIVHTTEDRKGFGAVADSGKPLGGRVG